jgi:hypothetical protein
MIGRERLPLVRMLELYERKYGIDDIGHVLAALSYIEDAEREPMPKVLVSLDWSDVKHAIQAWVKQCAA